MAFEKHRVTTGFGQEHCVLGVLTAGGFVGEGSLSEYQIEYY